MVFLGGDKDKKDGKENKEEEEVKDKHEHEQKEKPADKEEKNFPQRKSTGGITKENEIKIGSKRIE